MDKLINDKLDILNKIYEAREEEFEQNDQKDKAILKELSHEVSIEEIEEKIDTLFYKLENGKIKEKEQIIKQIELLIENYEIQISYYKQKNYKKGFKDAICLYTQCLKESDC